MKRARNRRKKLSEELSMNRIGNIAIVKKKKKNLFTAGEILN